MYILCLLLIAAFSYVLGGVNGAIITARLAYKADIREYGSGNPGLTNFYRNFGKNAVIFVILIDVLKTALPVLLGGWLLARLAEPGAERTAALTGRTLAGLFAMLGHAYPPLYQFRGGKTLLAGGTLIWFVDWRVGILTWGLFILIVLLTRYVSLGGVIAGAVYPFGMFLFGNTGWPLFFSAMGGALLIWRHKDNLKRLVRGEERKFSFKAVRQKNENEDEAKR